MADPAKGTSTDSMLNSLLSEAVWGAVVIPGYHHQHRNQGHRGTHTMPTPTPRGLNGRTLLPEDWVLLSPKPSADPPVLIETTRMFEFHEAADSHDGDFVLSCDHVMQRLKESERSKLHNYEIIGTRSCVDSDNSSTYEPDIDPKDIVVITFAEYIENIVSSILVCIFFGWLPIIVTLSSLYVYTVGSASEGTQRSEDSTCYARGHGKSPSDCWCLGYREYQLLCRAAAVTRDNACARASVLRKPGQ
jgi:hypothetical protein